MLVIFDWDGTLLNSLSKIAESMQLGAVDAGLQPRSETDIYCIIGLGLKEALATLYPGAQQSQLDSLSQRYSHHFLIKDQHPCKLYPDVQATLDGLKIAGHRIAVATGKSRRGLERGLANHGWQSFFDATRCADETRSKPDPLMLSELLLELDHDVEEAVMVGDTEFDLEMAAKIGMRRVAVSYGAHSPARLDRHQPEAIIDSLAQLRNLLNY